MFRIFGSLSLAFLLAQPSFAARIDVSDLSGFGPVILSTPNHFGLSGHSTDGFAIVASTSAFPPWFSDVRFDGTTYTYVYGITKAVFIGGHPFSPEYNTGEATNLSSFLIRSRLDGDWGYVSGAIPEHPSLFAGQDFGAVPVQDIQEVPGGLMIPGGGTIPLAFYLRSLEQPHFGVPLMMDYRMFEGTTSVELPPLDFTLAMDVYVPTPEPSTFLLCGMGLAAAYARHRHRRPRKGP